MKEIQVEMELLRLSLDARVPLRQLLDVVSI